MNDASINVLLIADHPGDAWLVEEMLKEARAPFRLAQANGLAECLAHLSQGGIDVLLLDLGLADGQGLDALVRARAAAPATPIVLLTDLDDEAVAVEAAQAGAQDYLVKGQFDANLLTRSLRCAIERKRAEEALRRSEVRLNEAQAVAHIGSWHLDIANDHLLWSDQTYRMFGVARGTPLTYGEFLQRVHPEDRQFARASWAAALQGEPYDIEHRIVVGDDVKWVGEKAQITFDEDGRPIGGMGTVQDITERKRAELQLRERERRFRTWLDNVRLVAVGLDVNGNVAYANPCLLELTGYTRDQVIGKSWFATFVPEMNRPAVGTVFTELIDRGTHAHYENPILTREGEERLIAWSNTLLFDEMGKPVGTMSIGEDITERKRAEQALRESEQLLRRVIDAIPAVIFLKDCNGNFLMVNDQVADIYGTDPENMVGTNERDHSVYPPAVIERFLEDDRQVIESGQPKVIPASVAPGPGGTTRWFHTVKVPLTVRGDPNCVLGVGVDATERVQAENALRESEQLLREVIDAVPAGIFVKDGDGNLILVNDTIAQAYGTTPRQLEGRNERDYSVYPPGVIDRYLEEDRQVVETGQPMVIPESPAPRSDGTTVWAYTVKVPLTVRGDPNCVVAVTLDVTERVRAEQALREAEAQLRDHEQLAAIGRLAGGIAHDFNNHLTTIMLSAQLALRKPSLAPDLTQGLENIVDGSRRAAVLVQQILDFSRRTLVDVQPLELGLWLEGLSYVLRHTLRENVQVVVQREVDGAVVNVDRGRIQQALMNLATNARDAMPDGGELRINLSRAIVRPHEKPPLAGMGSGDWACLTVSDTGTGMTADVRSHLFEPFFTTKEVGQGTGLGLAQVYGIVKQHGGHVDVDSEPGRGTVVRIYLPAHSDEAVETADDAPSLLRGNGETIMLVEDENDLREVGREILEGLGYRVLAAAHGREALEVFRSAEGVDLVITDMVMPHMGGKALMRELRRQHPGQKGLIISGYALKEDLEELRREGITDTVPKPFDAETLARVVRRALDEDR